MLRALGFSHRDSSPTMTQTIFFQHMPEGGLFFAAKSRLSRVLTLWMYNAGCVLPRQKKGRKIKSLNLILMYWKSLALFLPNKRHRHCLRTFCTALISIFVHTLPPQKHRGVAQRNALLRSVRFQRPRHQFVSLNRHSIIFSTNQGQNSWIF